MPPRDITTCQDLLTCLEQAVQGQPGSQTLELSGDLLAAAGDLIGYLGLTALTVEQIDAATPLVKSGAPKSCALVTGKAVLFPQGTEQLEYRIEIEGDVPSGAVTLRLTAKPIDPEKWSFGANFADLPDYLGVQDTVLEEKPSFYNSMAVAEPVFQVATFEEGAQKKGLTFSGLVDMTKGDLAAAGKHFSNADKTPAGGTIQLRDGKFPLFALTGDLGSYSLPKVGKLSLAFGTEDGDPAASTLLLVGESTISGVPNLRLSAPVMQGDFVWTITGELAGQQYPLTQMLSNMIEYAGVPSLPLPSGMGTDGFSLESVTVAVVPAKPPTLQMIGFKVRGPKKSWTAPLFGLTVSDLSTEWQIVSPTSDPQLIGSVQGVLSLGDKPDAPRLDISIDLNGIKSDSAPDVTLSANLDPQYPVSLSRLFSQLTGISIDLNLDITDLLFEAQTGPRTLQFAATIDGEWPFPVPFIKFGQANFLFQYTPNSITGSVSVDVWISSFRFLVSADYAGSGEGWEFAGHLAPDSQNNTLQAFVDGVTENRYPSLPGNLGTIELRKLDISFNTGSGAFAFDGMVVWPFKFLDAFDVTIEAELSLRSPSAPASGEKRRYSGFARGLLRLNNFQFSVVYNFDIENNKSLSFVFDFRGVTLTCTYKTDGKTRLLKANLGGVTFGGILEYLIGLAAPGESFTLPSPWDVLYSIRFDNLLLTANLTKNEVGIAYKVGTNLGVADIDTIGLTYKKKAGKGTVVLTMTGRFFDKKYEDTSPLTWDMLNDPPPSAPGKGDKLLDLRYLGIGQNVGFRTAKNFSDVKSVIKAMQDDFKRVPDDENPLSSPLLANLQFAGDGRWLIGADLTLMEAVTLNVVFNDPVLYGLRIALAGKKVKSFAGLDFQILYKKVTETIGVYFIELTLPDAYRQLQFGAVSVTLPVIVVEIYTNGNFRIDLGFPVGLDFSRSFCVQAGPFIGYGGFYFALLNGATSTRVPHISNGTFSPVIEAGLALSVGIGRTIDKGVFKAGATLTVVGILQGVFGWFNPNDNSAPSAQFYWIQGTVALAGKVNGSVDFSVVQIEVSLSLSASIVLTFESYKASLVVVTFRVTASASLKILFIRVSFSFSTSFEVSFTIGSSSPTPWILEAPPPSPEVLRQQAGPRPLQLSAATLQRAIVGLMDAEAGSFDWQPRSLFSELQPIPLTLMPALTVALPGRVQATAASFSAGASDGPAPEVQAVFALFVPTSVPADAVSAKAILQVANPAAAASDPFNRIAAGMLRWALSSYTRSALFAAPPPATETQITDLDAIGKHLADAKNWETAFSYSNLAGLMHLNYRLNISTPMGPFGVVHPEAGLLALGAAAPDVSYSVFPMVPELNVQFAAQQPRDFAGYHCITPEYEQALGTYYRQLRDTSSAPRETRAELQHAASNGPHGCPAGSESLATFLFRDYFAIVAKGAVQAASDLFRAYPYEASGIGMSGPTGQRETLSSITQQFNGPQVVYLSRPGDTPGRVAAQFGVSPEQVQAANPHLLTAHESDDLPPGTEVTVATSVTPQSIAAANQDYPLNYNSSAPVHLTINGAKYQVRAGRDNKSESLQQIAWSYGLAGAAALFPLNDFKNNNASNPAVLQPGSTIGIPARTVTMYNPAQDLTGLVAAFFYVRNLGDASPADEPWYADLSWYEQWILAENESVLPRTQWTVPVVELLPNGALSLHSTAVYDVQGGDKTGLRRDTPALVAGYFAMTQLEPAPWGAGYAAFAAGVKRIAGGSYSVPRFTHSVRPGDTVASLAQTFGISIADLVNENAAAPGLLQLLSVLTLPTVSYQIAKGDTLASVAAGLDLTLDDLARSVRDDPGILTPWKNTKSPITIPDVPARATDVLIADLVRYGSFNNISGMAANFLMHGMRVPLPDAPIVDKTFPPSTPLWSLYEMAGQQFPVSFDSSGPTGIHSVFGKTTADWIRFDGPGPSGPTGLAELPVYLTADYLADHPGLTLQPEILAGPASLPLYRETPPQYSFLHNTHWQASSVLPFPGPTGLVPPGPSGQVQPQAGQPSLWVFPPALQQVTAGATGPLLPSPAYKLVAQNLEAAGEAAATPIRRFCWGMAVDIRIQQAHSAAGDGIMPNAYIVRGADQEGRQLLLKAWTALELTPAPHGTIYLLHSPGAASQNAQGLASSILNTDRTFLLKSNLTTVTRSNLFALSATALPDDKEYSAPISAAPNFLRLLWEASVTGSGGFYLNYVSGTGGGGLPQELFASNDTAVLTLVFVSTLQVDPGKPERGLFPFNNCAIVGDNIDTASTTIFAQLAAPGPQDLQRIATASTGTVGYYLARHNPDAGASGQLPPADQTRSLYSMISTQLQEADGFLGSNWSLPLGPAEDPVVGVSGPTGPNVWWYQQMLPVAQFGKVNQAPQSPALPPAKKNPYAGIAGPTGLTGPASLNSVELGFAFGDIYGNETAIGITMPSLSIPVGYTDELIGPSTWPGIGLDYVFLAGSGDEVTLQADVSLQTTRYTPAGSYTFAQANKTATADAERFSQIFYQVQQADLNFVLETNLGKVAAAPETLKPSLTSFVSRASAYARTAAALEQNWYTTGGAETLEIIVSAYWVTPAELIAANPDVRLKALFKTSLVLPVILAVPPMNTLQSLVQGQSHTAYPPQCGQENAQLRSAGAGWIGGLRLGHAAATKLATTGASNHDTPLSVAQLAANNRTIPLNPGNLLRIRRNASSQPFPQDATLQSIAASLHCAVYEEFTDATGATVEVGLYVENRDALNIVVPNREITLGGKTANTGAAPTLQSVRDSFADLNWSTEQFIQQVQIIEGLLNTTGVLHYETFYIPQPSSTATSTAAPTFSLADMPASAGDLASLANANAAVANFYYPGGPVYLSYSCYHPGEFDTFTTLAAQAGLTVDQLVRYNSNLGVNPSVKLMLPNLFRFPEGADFYAALTPASTDSLFSMGTIVAPAAPDSGVAAISALNRFVPGVYADGVSITLDVAGKGKTISPRPTDSMDSVALQFGLEFDTFVAQTAKLGALYRAQGSVLIPLPKVPSHATTGRSLSWNQLAARFHLQPTGTSPAAASILAANRCLLFFLQLNAEIAAPGAKPIQVSTFDTVDTILRRFELEQGLLFTVDDLVRGNGDIEGLLTVGNLFLLPPNPASLQSGVAPQIPPQGTTAESQVVFPVTTTLRMQRNSLLVAPEFTSSPSVYENVVALTPRGWGDASSSLQLTNFATQFEEAFARYRLKCAVSRRGSGTGAQRAALWAMNFGTNGVSKFAVEAARPNFYALKPLSTELMSSEVDVQPYRSGCGLCPSTAKRFDSVDLDSWMQQFLSTIDLFLTTPYAVPAFQLGTLGPSGASRSLGAGDALSAPSTPRSHGPRSFAEIVHLGTGSSPAAELGGSSGPTGCGDCTGGTGLYGPSNYESIVAAKLSMAKELSDGVVPILEGIGPTGTYYSAEAREAMRQQMLVELSSAYSINAIVQFPVDVQSPCVLPSNPSGPSAQIPPRLSGSIVPVLQSASDTTLRATAQRASVSAAYFAAVLSAAQGILQQGATASYNGRTHTIAFNDTLGRLAVGLVDERLTPDDWPQWTQFVHGIAEQPLMMVGAALPMVRAARDIAVNAAFEDMARFFGVDAASLGKANQDLPDILLAGKELTIADHAVYTVKPGDSLSSIAAALQPPMDVPRLTNAIGNRTGILHIGRQLSLVELLPDVTLSTAKVSLGRVDSRSGVAPALCFLFSIKHPRQYKNLFLNLNYVINEAEYDIATVGNTGGYQESSWLTLLLPFGSDSGSSPGSGSGADFGVQTAMPQVQIPIPLRSYPVPPSLLAQSGSPALHPEPPKTPDEAVLFGKEWDYRFDYQGMNAAQDTDHVEVTFNTGRQNLFTSAAAKSRKRLIFEALARFIEVSAPLSADLAILPTLPPGAYDPRAAVAVQVLDVLTTGVAAALRANPMSLAAQDSWPELRYLYRVQTQSADQRLNDLQLHLERGPTGTSAWPLWPEILVQSTTGATGTGPDAGFLPLKKVAEGELTATYAYPPGFGTDQRLTQRFLFPRRDAIQNRNAWSGLYLTRNDGLIGSGPLGWGAAGTTGPMAPIETSQAFLYQTPLVRFVDPTTPLLVNGTEIDVPGLTGPVGPKRTLAAQIETMIDALLEWAAVSPGGTPEVQAPQYLSLLCSYGYALAGAGTEEEIVATIPVLLMPTEFLSPLDKSAFALSMSQAIENWPGWPTRDAGGRLIFDVSIYSLPYGATGPVAELKPLLQYQNLRVPVIDIKST